MALALSSRARHYALVCAFALTATLAATDARAEAPSPNAAAESATDASPNAAATTAPPAGDGASTAHALRAEFGAALVKVRATHAFIAQKVGSNPRYEAHDALLEGMIRLQRDDHMAWEPEACAKIATGVEQLYAARGANRSGVVSAQLEVSSVLQLAAMCNTAALGHLAMQGVSYALPDMRNRGTEQRLATALAQIAAVGDSDALSRVSVPYMLPYFEALLTIADAAGLERVVAARVARATRPDAHVDRYLSLAQAAPTPRVQVNAPEGCTVLINGERVDDTSVELRVGWHSVACVDGARERFRYTSDSTTLFPVDE